MAEDAPVKTVEVGADDDGVRLDRWFKRQHPHLGHGQLEKLLRTGQIRVDGGRAKANFRLKPGQVLRLPPAVQNTAEPRAKPAPQLAAKDRSLLKSWILKETATFVALNKPPGLAIQGGSGTLRHLDGLLLAQSNETGERWRLVHRLDKDTSGVLLVAKSSAYAAKLTREFRARETEKIYWALTAGVPTPRQGRIDLALAKRAGEARRGREAMVGVDASEADAQRAISDFLVLADALRIAYVAVRPLTGRTHQIRAHLAAIGTPVLGDVKYGGDAARPGGAIPPGMMLHARSLTFTDPQGHRQTIVAPPPPAMLEALKLFGFQMPKTPPPFPAP